MSTIATVKIDIHEVVATGFGFQGCTDRNADYCACGDDTEVTCETCCEPIEDGQLIREVTVPEHWQDLGGNYESRVWHVVCPEVDE